MAADWYCEIDGQQQGPVTSGQLRQLAVEGKLQPSSPVWKDGMPRWLRASSLQEPFPDPASALDRYFAGPRAAAASLEKSSAGASATSSSGSARRWAIAVDHSR